ncbi:hypothetical protein ACV3PA_02735 [Exiguobacterium acetylicum]
MYSEMLFHGSNKRRGEALLQTQIMPITRGSTHWLGDGSYFFTEEIHAYKWIVDMYKKKYFGSLNHTKLLTHYIIVETLLTVPKVRVFDLTKAEHKIIFDTTLKLMMEKKQIPSNEMAEGVVLNYLFNSIGYSKDYDMVRALFEMNRNKYKGVRSRLGYLPQEQICIKNVNVLDQIREYDFAPKIKSFDTILENYYF